MKIEALIKALPSFYTFISNVHHIIKAKLIIFNKIQTIALEYHIS